jgi:hypothetical protein
MTGLQRSSQRFTGGATAALWLGVIFGTVGLNPGNASADTLVLYNGQNADNTTQTTSPYAANTIGLGVTAGSLTTHSGLGKFQISTNTADHASAPLYQVQSNTLVENNNKTPNDDGAGSPQQTTALTNNSYFSFTLTAANPGQKLKLSSISFNVGQGTSSNTQERGYALYWDVAGFDSASKALIADAKIDGYREPGGNWAAPSISLGNVEVTSVNFRFYVFVGDGAGTASNIEFDNIIVTGLAPEPASLGLLSAPALALFARRRRRAV